MAREMVESWRFKYQGLTGYISCGHEHGVELTSGADRKPVTKPMCLNLEHYYARRSSGRFVPRYKAEVASQRIGNDQVRVDIAPYGEWKVHAVITYKLLPEMTIEACYEFAFDADYVAFEAFISNYFYEPTEPYLPLGGRWVQPQLSDREHRYWARSADDAAKIQDGRLDGFLADMEFDYAVPVDPQYYDYPMMVTPIGDSGWSIIHVIEREMCPSLSANRTWNAHDFSLLGRDVSKGETVRCRAWMAYRKLESLDEALKLYERITHDLA